MTGPDPVTDVLVVGGGPAATRAALKAARDGTDVVLADKPPLRHQRRHRLPRHIGWGRGRTPGALGAVGPPLGPPGSEESFPPITS
ncbi:FAD-dependent oxidoreductase [Streptomyces heilongjiangensis]|uniref:FAD-dependent oxidoreductase n=1 Tax=Streptomyces heilongjiangensis TaxID=945052 RepID=A0ABW1BEF0_9ACTN|nr:FAD-dependent oxidoreductase [Streptomyces heilongjiangensis]MDC2951024.1 FAD-dependent oxidoreductase [Streptomyces heilongjiangensis]